MLVLTRKENQQIKIGEGVIVTILAVRANSVKIGIEAPREVRVLRGELTTQLEGTPAIDAEPLKTSIGSTPSAVSSPFRSRSPMSRGPRFSRPRLPQRPTAPHRRPEAVG